MAKFPRTEPEVIALANGLIAGLTTNTTVYPSPPLTIEELTANLNKVIASQGLNPRCLVGSANSAPTR
ncbi:MAG: hypothetical protein EBE86_003640 [Hormoscilla sp. GUM202]|nr:hypothetical protein [Hormoscilla sp. GUM202]